MGATADEIPFPSPPSDRVLLVATDFSPPAAAALAWAVAVAPALGARLQLLHVVVPVEPALDHLTIPVELTDEVRRAAEQKLGELAEEARRAGVETAFDVREGPAWRVISEVAGEIAATLVVVGAQGIGRVAHLLLGSTAERVVQHAPVPVLTVHPDDGPPTFPPASVLVPTDFSASALEAARVAVDLLGLDTAGARLHLLHVYGVPSDYTVYGPTGLTTFSERYREGLRRGVEEELCDLARTLRRGRLLVETRAVEGQRPAEVIVDEAARQQADLLVMGTHGRTGLGHFFLGSTAERVVGPAPCPVLTVRQGSREGTP